MVQRRGYPRGPLERTGNNTWRDVDVSPSPVPAANNNGLLPRSPDDRDPTPRHKREGIEPNCCVLFIKRKGFGTLGEKQSEPGSIHKTNYLLKSFKVEQFQRYRVNIYLK